MLATKEAGLTRALATLADPFSVRRTGGGPFMASPASERVAASRESTASTPKCPTSPNGLRASSGYRLVCATYLAKWYFMIWRLLYIRNEHCDISEKMF